MTDPNPIVDLDQLRQRLIAIRAQQDHLRQQIRELEVAHGKTTQELQHAIRDQRRGGGL